MSGNSIFSSAARLSRLLGQIGRGSVHQSPDGQSQQFFAAGDHALVTDDVAELEQAGIARIGGVVTDGPYRHVSTRPRRWQLTRSGEQTLEAMVRERESCRWCASGGEPATGCRCTLRCGYGGCCAPIQEVRR